MNRDRFKVARPMAKLREGRNDWYSIKALAEGETEILVYDEIGYWGVTASDFVRELSGLDTDRITLRLNSPGGEVFDGIAIYNGLKQHKAEVTVQVEGLAASIASVIAMAGDKIVMAKNATMMIHDGHGICVGNASDMTEMADLLNKTSNNIASIYAERAGGDIDEWRGRMRTETWYSAEEAVEAGLADEVQGESTAKNTWDLSIYAYAGRDAAPVPQLSREGRPQAPAPEPDSWHFDLDVLQRALKEAAQ